MSGNQNQANASDRGSIRNIINIEVTEENAKHIDEACREFACSVQDYINQCIQHYSEFHYTEILDIKKSLKNTTATHPKE